MRWVTPCIAHTCILYYINLLARAVLTPAYFLISSDLQDHPGMPPLPTFRKTNCLDTHARTHLSVHGYEFPWLSSLLGLEGKGCLLSDDWHHPYPDDISYLFVSRKNTSHVKRSAKVRACQIIDPAVRGLWNGSWKDTSSPSRRVLADISRLESPTCHSSSTSRRYSSEKQSLPFY